MSDTIVITLNLSRQAADMSCTINVSVTHIDKKGVNVSDDLFYKNTESSSISSVLSDFNDFNKKYRSCEATRSAKERVIIEPGQDGSYDEDECNKSIDRVISGLNSWLDSSINPQIIDAIRDKLQSNNLTNLPIRLAFETKEASFQDLPWDNCNKSMLFSRLRTLTEKPSVNSVISRKVITSKVQWGHPLKILIIKGNTKGLKVEEDIKSIKKYLLAIEVEPEIFPEDGKSLSIKELNDLLWNNHWDIIFYLGHTSTNRNRDDGLIEVDSNGKTISIKDLTNALLKSIDLGLQVLIFNSCDGNGLARKIYEILEREGKRLPHIVVMRRKINDLIANIFIERFTKHFFQDQFSIEESIAQTNQYLHSFKNQYPGADSLASLWCDTKSPHLSVPSKPTTTVVPPQYNLWQRIRNWLLESVDLQHFLRK
jgi:branched-chain amino acid transport system substrate-binding protein